MRVQDPLFHPLDHAGVTNVTPDQHHDAPENVEFSNTSLSCPPLPGGPTNLDVVIPDNANVAKFWLHSVKTVAQGGARAGCFGVCSSNSLRTSTYNTGGHVPSIIFGNYSQVYSKVASALNLSDKVFSSAGDYIALANAFITTSGPNRVLRFEWTNYGFSTLTLNVWGEIAIIG